MGFVRRDRMLQYSTKENLTPAETTMTMQDDDARRRWLSMLADLGLPLETEAPAAAAPAQPPAPPPQPPPPPPPRRRNTPAGTAPRGPRSPPPSPPPHRGARPAEVAASAEAAP